MLKARRKNRVLRIPDEKMQEYKALGYTIMDESGRVLCEPENKDREIDTLKAKAQADAEKIAGLEHQIEELNAQIESMKVKAATAAKEGTAAKESGKDQKDKTGKSEQ